MDKEYEDKMTDDKPKEPDDAEWSNLQKLLKPGRFLAVNGGSVTYVAYDMEDTFVLHQIQETQVEKITLSSDRAKQVADFIIQQLKRKETKK